MQIFFLLPQKNNKKKNIETNKANEQMDLKQERRRKNLGNKKNKSREKTLNKHEEMEKLKYVEILQVWGHS